MRGSLCRSSLQLSVVYRRWISTPARGCVARSAACRSSLQPCCVRVCCVLAMLASFICACGAFRGGRCALVIQWPCGRCGRAMRQALQVVAVRMAAHCSPTYATAIPSARSLDKNRRPRRSRRPAGSAPQPSSGIHGGVRCTIELLFTRPPGVSTWAPRLAERPYGSPRF